MSLLEPVQNSSTATALHDRVTAALDTRNPDSLRRCRHVPAAGEHDELLALLSLHDLWLEPLDRLDGKEVFHGHPATAELQQRLERNLLARLRRRTASLRRSVPDGVPGMRRVAALDLVPTVYRWLQDDATWSELVDFLAVEGGPDAGFDDLVALAQVGIRGDAKVALAANYWDELGRGDNTQVHTKLHDDLVAAVDLPRIPRAELPTSALERAALGGLLACNRSLQPELIGALGLLELQAGPRCRAVVRAMHRLSAPTGALPFYKEHADTDPRHGKEWLDRVVTPLAADPRWSRRMVDGAIWRHDVNQRFFAEWNAE